MIDNKKLTSNNRNSILSVIHGIVDKTQLEVSNTTRELNRQYRLNQIHVQEIEGLKNKVIELEDALELMSVVAEALSGRR